MHDSYLLLLLVLLTNADRHSVFSNGKDNDLSLQDASRAETKNPSAVRGLKNLVQEENQDNGKKEISTLKELPHDNTPSSKLPVTTTSINKNIGRSYYHLDPVFDSLKNRRIWNRKKKQKSSSSSNSEIENIFWMEDWGEQRENQKAEALNSSKPRQEVLNMKMARPSGIPCGDPNLHDIPWGTCTRSAECEQEFRIHRGDPFCGRSQYVCCSIVDTTYDMYQAPDMSFEHDNSLTTDSDVDKGYRDTHEEKQKERLQRKHEKSKRKRTKALLKKKLRHSITHIITEITKLLSKAYRNATSIRIKKSKDLMDFIKAMKKQYRKDRESLVNAHEFNILKYDVALEKTLKKIRGVNEAFLTNATFRDIIVNGTVNKKMLKKLQRNHPVLSLFYKNRRMGGDFEPEQTGKKEPDLEKEDSDLEKEKQDLDTEESEEEEQGLEDERSESEEDEPEPEKEKPKGLDYDVEYGVLYF